MNKAEYRVFEDFMIKCMGDSAHDKEHIYRVLYTALDIANHETSVNRDKVDVAGAVGIARTLFYKGIVNEPLYETDEQGKLLDGTTDSGPSFLQEYNYKLKTLYDKFYTKRGLQIAGGRQQAAVSFYNNMLSALASAYEHGRDFLYTALE